MGKGEKELGVRSIKVGGGVGVLGCVVSGWRGDIWGVEVGKVEGMKMGGGEGLEDGGTGVGLRIGGDLKMGKRD